MIDYEFERGIVYKINMPQDYEINNFVEDYLNTKINGSISPVLNSFFLNEEKVSKLFVKNLLNKYNFSDELFNKFYIEFQESQIKFLSVRQKFILTILIHQNIFDFVLISLEALSIKTIDELMSLGEMIVRNRQSKSLLFFNFSTLKETYTKLEIQNTR